MRKFKAVVSTVIISSLLCGSIYANPINNTLPVEVNQDNELNYEFYVGDFKIVYLETPNELIVSQYSQNGTLIDKCTYNKNTKTATSFNEEDGLQSLELFNIDILSSINLEDENINETSSITRAIPSGYSYVGVVTAEPFSSASSYNMKIYYNLGSATQTTYTINKGSSTVAAFVVSVCAGMGFGAVVADSLISNLLAASFCTVTGSTIKFLSATTLASKQYAYNYYGVDSNSSSKNAYFYNAGYKYIINDANSSKLGQTYYEAYAKDISGFMTSTAYWSVADTLAYRVYGDSCNISF